MDDIERKNLEVAGNLAAKDSAYFLHIIMHVNYKEKCEKCEKYGHE